MYAYNMYWDSIKSILLYPKSNQEETSFGRFHKGRESEDNLCKLGFIKVWDKKEDGIILRESVYSDIEQMLEV